MFLLLLWRVNTRVCCCALAAESSRSRQSLFAVQFPACGTPDVATRNSMESLLLDLSQAFQWPIISLVLLSFAYSMLKLGGFVIEGIQRVRHPNQVLVLPREEANSLESLELIVLRELEGLRLCSRVAPMLGLVATMIPLGPALIAVSSGNSGITASNLGAAFAAVIVALVAASIAFAIHTIRRRWLLQELNQLLGTRP